MGLKDLVKKTLTGATDEENRKNRERMREIFNQRVEDGNDYTLIYCHSQSYTDAVLVKITRHSNFIVGYKEVGERTVVVIPVDPTLSEAQEPRIFTKRIGAVVSASKLGYCNAQNKDCSYTLEPITYEPGIKRESKYNVSIVQSGAEVQNFKKFCKAGL